MIADFIGSVAGMHDVEDPAAISPDVVRKSLRLRLFPCADKSEGEPVARDPSMDDLLALIVRRPAMPGTEWLLYLRRPGAGQGVIADHLARWGIAVDEAFELARQNTLECERGQLYERGGVLMESGDSMFAHAAVLSIANLCPSAAALGVAVPNRHVVLAAPVQPDDAGIEALVAVMTDSLSRYSADAYRIHPGAWFVPPAGIGRFGENAESIELVNHAPDGCAPELGVKFGPDTRRFFAELG